MYLRALANLEFSILLPMAVGLALGAVAISAVMSALFHRFYTGTFCVIFGIFLTMIPNMLTPACALGFNGQSVLSLALAILGFGISFFLGDLEKNKERLGRLFRKRG